MSQAIKETWTAVAYICASVIIMCAVGVWLLPQVAGTIIASGAGIILSQIIIATALPIFYGWHRK